MINNKVNEFIREVVQQDANNNILPGGGDGDADLPPNAIHLLLDGVCRLTTHQTDNVIDEGYD